MNPILDDPTAKAFEFARDNAKVLITLSTAVVAASATVGKALLGDDAWEGSPRWLIFISWALFLVSIAAGQFVLMSIAGAVSPTRPDGTAKTDYRPSVYASGLVLATKVHQVSFALALLGLVAFGVAAV